MTISKDLWAAYSRIFFVELAYWVVSIGMVFVNEFVLSANVLTDDLTVFITIFQILFSLSILVTLNYLTKFYLNSPPNAPINLTKPKEAQSISIKTKLTDEESVDIESKRENPIRTDLVRDHETKNKSTEASESISQLFHVHIPHRLNLETCKLVFPLSILYIGMLLLNNFCLKNVGVAFYFVSRSLTTVFNVIFTYILIDEPVSRGALICCTLIVLGFILGIDQESVIGSLSVMGVIFGVASSLFTSLFSIYTKKTLAKLDKNIWVLVLYNNLNAIIICTPLLILHGDIQALIVDKVISPPFWFILSISGVIAFFISIVTNASIKYTSPLTHNISGTAKACLQTVIAVVYRHDHKSVLWWVSNITILGASAAYSRIKQLEMERRAACLPHSTDSRGKSTEPTSLLRIGRRSGQDDSSGSDSDGSEVFFETRNRDCCSVKLLTSNKETD